MIVPHKGGRLTHTDSSDQWPRTKLCGLHVQIKTFFIQERLPSQQPLSRVKVDSLDVFWEAIS